VLNFHLQIVDQHGVVKSWIDASEPGTGNWLKYVRSSGKESEKNIMAVQVKDQVGITIKLTQLN